MLTVVMKGCFYVGTLLCRLCEFNIFCPRDILDMDSRYVFPQSELAVILTVGVIGFVPPRAHTRCWVGLSLWSVAFLMVGFAPKYLG